MLSATDQRINLYCFPAFRLTQTENTGKFQEKVLLFVKQEMHYTSEDCGG